MYIIIFIYMLAQIRILGSTITLPSTAIYAPPLHPSCQVILLYLLAYGQVNEDQNEDQQR